jgi:hypothetical protein
LKLPVTRRWAVAVAATLLSGAALSVGLAGAEQSGRDGVEATLDGSITPDRLPRRHAAPVFITLSGSIQSSVGSPPPRLSRIELAFGAPGGLSTKGLPVCPRRLLRNATQRQALDRCRSALIGHGTILTEVPLAPSRPLLAHAAVLAFNGEARGHPAVWVHAYATAPPVSFVLPFYLHRLRAGGFGVVMRAPVYRALGRWPRLRFFRVTLGRRYRADGVLRSYLNARCPLPPRFHSLSLPLARIRYEFAPSPTVSIPILRACRAVD